MQWFNSKAICGTIQRTPTEWHARIGTVERRPWEGGNLKILLLPGIVGSKPNRYVWIPIRPVFVLSCHESFDLQSMYSTTTVLAHTTYVVVHPVPGYIKQEDSWRESLPKITSSPICPKKKNRVHNHPTVVSSGIPSTGGDIDTALRSIRLRVVRFAPANN